VARFLYPKEVGGSTDDLGVVLEREWGDSSTGSFGTVRSRTKPGLAGTCFLRPTASRRYYSGPRPT
jgi:hypothetical protein